MRSARLQIDHRRAAEVLIDGVKPAAITSRVTHEWVYLVGGTHGPWDRGPSATLCLSMWLPAWPHCAGPTASDPLPLSLIAWRFSIHEVPKREGSRLVAVTLSQKDKNIK